MGDVKLEVHRQWGYEPMEKQKHWIDDDLSLFCKRNSRLQVTHIIKEL